MSLLEESGQVLVVVAHPDDETVSLGATLARLAGRCTLLTVTDGAPRDPRFAAKAGLATREAYAATRRAEQRAALALVGLGPESCRELGYVDQEAALHLVELVGRLREEIQLLAPRAILTHPYEGGHPDHDAVAAAVHYALALLGQSGGAVPALLEFASYHAGEGKVTRLEFLSAPECPETTLALSPLERERKHQMYQCYPSQLPGLHVFPIGVERWRPAPRYDFTRPPHAGPMHYEKYPWAVREHELRRLLMGAGEQLGVAGAWEEDSRYHASLPAGGAAAREEEGRDVRR